MATKEFWKSKTFWFNVLAGVVTVAAAFGYGEQAADPTVVAVAGGVVAVINVILRLFFTDTKLTA